jgi:hypothetical protein
MEIAKSAEELYGGASKHKEKELDMGRKGQGQTYIEELEGGQVLAN